MSGVSTAKRRVAVIGGGVTGLATAALLSREGYQVRVFEAAEVSGGRAGQWETNGFRFDLGPSWYLMPEVFDHFYRLLGTSTEEQLRLVTLEPGYQVFFEEQASPVLVRAGRKNALALFEALEPGSTARAEKYLNSAQQVYAAALNSFLYTNYGSLRAVLRPDVLRNAARMASLLTRSLDRYIRSRFADSRLRRILGYPAVFLGASPMTAAAIYHLMSHLDLGVGVEYPLGGLSEVTHSLDRLARAEGAEIFLGSEVVRILTSSGARPVVTGVRYRDQQGTLRDYPAELVVSTADLHHTETALLPESLQTYPERWWSRRTPGPGAVLVYLGIRGELPQLEHHNLFFVREWEENFTAIFDPSGQATFPDPASIYVCRPSASDPVVAPAGHENLFVLVPVPADPSIGAGGDDGQGDPLVESIADAALRQIEQWSGCHDLRERIVLRRTRGPADFAGDYRSWAGSALGPAHTLGQSAFLRGRNASAKVGGLLYAGATTVPGVGLPMCLISAELVLKRLRGDQSADPLQEPL